MTTSRDTILFATVMGTDDCPLPRLTALEYRLRAAGRVAEAAAVAQTTRDFIEAEQRLSRLIQDGPRPAFGPRAALNAHSIVLTQVQNTLALHEPANA